MRVRHAAAKRKAAFFPRLYKSLLPAPAGFGHVLVIPMVGYNKIASKTELSNLV